MRTAIQLTPAEEAARLVQQMENRTRQAERIASRYRNALESIRDRGQNWEEAGKRGAVGWRDQLILCAEDAEDAIHPPGPEPDLRATWRCKCGRRHPVSVKRCRCGR